MSSFTLGNGSDSDCVAHGARLWRTAIGAELTADMIDVVTSLAEAMGSARVGQRQCYAVDTTSGVLLRVGR